MNLAGQAGRTGRTGLRLGNLQYPHVLRHTLSHTILRRLKRDLTKRLLVYTMWTILSYLRLQTSTFHCNRQVYKYIYKA